MLKRKRLSEKGKIKFSKYFQHLEEGDRVSIVRDPSMPSYFPTIIQGRTGVIEGKRGSSYIINIRLGKNKRYLVHPIHLKRLK